MLIFVMRPFFDGGRFAASRSFFLICSAFLATNLALPGSVDGLVVADGVAGLTSTVTEDLPTSAAPLVGGPAMGRLTSTMNFRSFSRLVGRSSNASSSLPSPYCLTRFGRRSCCGGGGAFARTCLGVLEPDEPLDVVVVVEGPGLVGSSWMTDGLDFIRDEMVGIVSLDVITPMAVSRSLFILLCGAGAVD